ncbi:hypothetical protein CRUP_028050, partial [Coryphaenoides rupestris]
TVQPTEDAGDGRPSNAVLYRGPDQGSTKWMLMDGRLHAAHARNQPAAPCEGEAGVGEYSEQVLRLMHSLGIDQHKTVESLQNKSYNHFAAIYYLLVERLKAHRCSFPVDQRLEARQRRPSTIAEQTSSAGQGQVSVLPQGVRLLRSPALTQASSSDTSFTFPQACSSEHGFMVNGCLLDPLPPLPTAVLRKSSTSSPSNMMETSIDEGIETEEPDAEDDPAHLLSAYQTARFGQRRHTLSEVTNQPGPSSQGKLFALGHNPSLGSVDSDMGYEMGSVNSDLSLLAGSSAPRQAPGPFLSARPANPTMAALTCQRRETHNRSPISFREGRRASDTSLTQDGFRRGGRRRHGSPRATAALAQPPGGRGVQAAGGAGSVPGGGRPASAPVPQTEPGDSANALGNSPASCQLYCKDLPRSLEQQLQEHRLHQKRMYLQQQQHHPQGPGLQSYFNQMQIAEGSYTSAATAMDPAAPAGSTQGPAMPLPPMGPPQPQPHPHIGPQPSSPFHPQPAALLPLVEPGEGMVFDPYMSHHHHHHHHHYTQQPLQQHHLHQQQQFQQPPLECPSLGYGGYPSACELQLPPSQTLGPPGDALYAEQYEFSLDPGQPLPPALAGEVCGMGGLAAATTIVAGPGQYNPLGLPAELQDPLLDSEMETADSQHGFVLVN